MAKDEDEDDLIASLDWFDHADGVERVAVAEWALTKLPDLQEIAPGQWGEHGLGVFFVGNEADMRKVRDKNRHDMLYRSDKRPVADRLPIWC